MQVVGGIGFEGSLFLNAEVAESAEGERRKRERSFSYGATAARRGGGEMAETKVICTIEGWKSVDLMAAAVQCFLVNPRLSSTTNLGWPVLIRKKVPDTFYGLGAVFTTIDWLMLARTTLV
jgi:hypothetical protein